MRKALCEATGTRARCWYYAVVTACLGAASICSVEAADLAQTIVRVKPSVVGVGTFVKTRSPSLVFVGTGFAVADGRHVVTNAHVLRPSTDTSKIENTIVLVSKDGEPESRESEVLAIDKEHDLALLKISGEPLPALKLGDSASVTEGKNLAFTGFPIGIVLGFHPATHRAMVSAITPVALPGLTAKHLTAETIARIRQAAYKVFQLDGTAYPGNSGSPLFDPSDATVYGIINSVFVQGTRENAVKRPSGITYAIPSRHVIDLLHRHRLDVSP